MDIINSNNGSGNTPDNNQYPDKTINESQLPQSGGAGPQLQRSDLPGELSGKTYTTKNLPTGQNREKLGSGTITGVLGEGGMAKVYKIWNEELEISRAVKILLPDEMGKNTERFMTEMKITANLQHANIVLIHNIGTWKGLPFIEMELLEGETLEKHIERQGALPQKFCCSIGIQIAQALAYAHNREIQIYGKKYTGVIHRDLKPSNIMISPDGTIKLMDFGIARPTEIGLHTLDGYLVGTPQYFSPEQMANKNLDGRTDIYSFGVIFYEMLSGKKAFPQDNLYSIMQAIENSEYKRLKEYDLKIHPSLAAFTDKCMHTDREKRFENAAAMLAELIKIASSLKTDTRKGIKRTEAIAEIVKDTTGFGKAAANKKIYLKPAILIPVLLLILGIGGFLIFKPSSHKKVPKPEPVSESPAAVPEPVSRPEPVSVSVSDSISTPGSANVPDSIATPAPAPLAETKGMVWIEGGSFMMGNSDGQDDEKPAHKVTLSGFYLDTTEVTQKEYRRVMGKNPSYFKGCLTCPAENVTWHDATEYCAKLGKRLPSEAEWEYAARAGSTATYYWGDQNATYYARFDANSKGRTKPVAGKKPNAWGLYDMSGNVWEWCNDWYGPYPDKSQQNPKGAVTGDSRVLRGGACVSGSSGLGTANRSYDKPDFRANHTGFRCARSQ